MTKLEKEQRKQKRLEEAEQKRIAEEQRQKYAMEHFKAISRMFIKSKNGV